jgi:hypothetical protein
MKSGISIWFGMGMLLCCFLMGCEKVIAPVDTYGFKQAFDEKPEPQAGSTAIGEVSIKLAEEVLNAVRSNDLAGAQAKLESLRKQTDLSPRQRLETKALHTAVVDFLSRSEEKVPEQSAVSSSSSSLRQNG